MGILFIIGGVVGYAIACLISGRLLPVLSLQTLIGVLLGEVAAVVVMFLAAKSKTDTTAQNDNRQPDLETIRKNKSNIIAELQSLDTDVRAQAITNLAVLKDLDTIDLFLKCLRDPEQSVQLRATEALSWVTGRDFGEDVAKWNEWWTNNKPPQPSVPYQQKVITGNTPFVPCVKCGKMISPEYARDNNGVCFVCKKAIT